VAAKSIKNNKQDDVQGWTNVAGGRTPGATVSNYAEEHGLTEQEVLTQGMQEKAVEFIEKGGEIYKKV
jgi:hypothetical protein